MQSCGFWRMELDHKLGLDWISCYGPKFSVSGDDIEVLKSPRQFYATLLKCIQDSQKRVYISTLYIGTGLQEQQLVSSLQESLRKYPDLKVRILLDYCRGTRGHVNSCTLLQPLINLTNNADVQISLYHTPKLRGLLKRVLPDRWRESVGVQHMKIYIFDDTVIISGANLSDSYFTDRQDRYMVIKNCALLADYMAEIQMTVSSASFALHPTGGVRLAEQCHHHPYASSGRRYHSMLYNRMMDTMDKWRKKPFDNISGNDTIIFPLVQMGNVGIHDDNQVHRFIFGTQKHGTFDLASGYFNLVDDYEELIGRRSQLPFRILAASPKANGFFNGSGVSKYVPALYVHVMKQFYKLLGNYQAHDRVRLFEYERKDWTFHGKGVWWAPDPQSAPLMTLIGSPNYGYRSVQRDLELELVVMTENNGLRVQLDQERKALFEYARPVRNGTFSSADHFVPIWVRFVSRFIKSFF